jgi:superfamily I DNA/RNA helicase
MSWLIPRSELTPDQIRAVEFPPTGHHALVGGPGSGKTQVLLHRARHLCDEFGVSPDRFRIFVYTAVLKDYIKSALRDLNLPDDCVVTLDNWCRLFYQEHVSSKLPRDAENHQPDFAAIRAAVYRAVDQARRPMPSYDFVLVDEGQDLEEDAFTLLTRIARHVTVCLDHKQQIYEKGSTEVGILQRLGLRKRHLHFIEAFRVCPYLVEVAAQFIADPLEREAFREQQRTTQTERQTPLLYYARDFDEERQKLYEFVRERQLKNDRIAILFPQNRQVFGFAEGLRAAGVEVEVPKQKASNASFPAHDFASSRPKLMAYHSVKGLTFDSVFMPRLAPTSFKRVHEDRIERLLFVALTRATKWVYLSTSLTKPLPLIDRLRVLERSRKLSVMRSGRNDGGAQATSPSGVPGSPEDAFDFL